MPLTASEASVWLREILSSWTPNLLSNIVTHSAKATILSWMSKSNVDIGIRRLAGYHITPGDKSALEYSRDSAAPILREVEAIFIAIRAGVFCPDAVRSDCWRGAQSLEESVKLASSLGKSACSQDTIGQPLSFGDECGSDSLVSPASVSEVSSKSGPQVSAHSNQVFEWNDDTTLEEIMFYRKAHLSESHVCHFVVERSDVSDMSSEYSSSLDGDSDSADLGRRVDLDGERNAGDLVAPSDLAGKTCVRHCKSKKLHFLDKNVNGQQFFRCGRKMNSNYEHVDVVPALTAHGCMMCFGWSDARDALNQTVSIPSRHQR